MGRRKKRTPTYEKIDQENLDHLLYNMKMNPNYDECDVSIKITDSSRLRLQKFAKSMHHHSGVTMRYEDALSYMFLLHHKHLSKQPKR